MQELFPEKSKELRNPNTIIDATPYAQHCEDNIRQTFNTYTTLDKSLSNEEKHQSWLDKDSRLQQNY